MAQPVQPGDRDGTQVRRRWQLNKRMRLILAKFATTSAISTVASQLVVALLFWTEFTTAGVALAASYLVGGVLTYFLNRRWTWRKRGKADLRTELLPYVALITVCGVATVGLSKLIHVWVGPLVADTPLRGIALNACLLVAGGLIMLVKLVSLHRLFGGRTAAAA